MGAEAAQALRAFLEWIAPYLERLGIFILGRRAEAKAQESASDKAKIADLEGQKRDDAAVDGLTDQQRVDELLHGPRR